MDLETRVQSNLLQWPKRLVTAPDSNTDSLVEVFSFNLSKVPEEIKHLPFYVQMFKHWIQVHSHDPTTESDVHREVIWNNRWITCNGRTLFWCHWRRKGINTIDNLCNNEGRLCSHTELSEQFHIRCTFLDAIKLCMSIPLHWRSIISPNWSAPLDLAAGTGIRVLLPGEDPRDLALINSKVVYSSIILGNAKSPMAYNRWSETMEASLRVNNEVEWKDICMNPFRTVRETKMQSLQYKINNRIIPCNAYLK